MLHIPKIRTRRITVQPRELTLGEAIALCKIAPERTALAETALLAAAFGGMEATTATHVTDHRALTLQERAYLVARYIQATGEADFQVGDHRLSDYLDFAADVALSESRQTTDSGKTLFVHPMLGVHAEVLERVCSGYGDWLVGAMAAQVLEEGEAPHDWLGMSEVDAMAAMSARMKAIREMPESSVEERFAAWVRGSAELAHFFAVQFDADGPCFGPIRRNTMEAAAPMPPGRFPALSAVGILARRIAGVDV